MTVRVAHVATTDVTHRFLLLGQLRALRDRGFDVTAISAPGRWHRDLDAEGISFLPWHNATRAWNLRADARAFAELVRILRAGRFDIVHTHNPKPGVMGRIAARVAGVPHVVNTVHGVYATPEDPPVKRIPIVALEWLASRFTDLDLYQSAEDLAWMTRLGVARRGRRAHLGNGTDLERFDPGRFPPDRVEALRRSLGIPKGTVVVGAVGRMVAEKGYRELFSAARAVRARRPHTLLLVVGESDGEKWDAIGAEEIASAGDGVLVTGWRDDVDAMLAVMDVFVLPSWREGMPRSAIEAAAMGKPLVLTNIRGCREVARPEQEAIFVPVRDPGRLGEAILRLVDDASLRRRLGSAARARALERFDERAIAAAVGDAYDRLLGMGAGGDGHALEVRPARRTDAAAMARLHAESLPEAFIPALGRRFVTSLYRALVDDPEAVAFVASNGSGVVGFAAGVTSVGGFYRRFALRHGAAAGLAAAPRLLRPGVARRVLETARYPSASGNLPDAELLAIGVAEEARGRGVGRRLAEGVLDGLGALGRTDVKVVVAADNEAANAFYADVGFVRAASIAVHDGRESNVLVRQCRS